MREIITTLQNELKQLEFEFRVELPREIKTAVAHGDLRENSEYKAALERQAFVRARIGQLRERLSSLSSMNMSQIPKDKAGLGSRVLLLDQDSDEEIRYELVIPEMSDIDKGRISIASPIGRSFVGKQPGDEIVAKIPNGTRHFELLELQTLHDLKTDLNE
jgi:transcription elongation factor GreA